MLDINPRCAWAARGNPACAARAGQWCLPCQVWFGGAAPLSRPLTAETITEPQVSELLTFLTATESAGAVVYGVRECIVALGLPDVKPSDAERAAAREVCAKIINDRALVDGETITDEQIWELHRGGHIDAYRLMMARSHAPNWRREHRAKCAELFNAVRTGASQRCSRCGELVHRTHDHLDVSENGERWTCQGGR